MGRQVRFYVDKYDHFELLRFAEEKGFQAVPQIIEDDTLAESWPPTRYPFEVSSGEMYFYLLASGFSIEGVSYQEVPAATEGRHTHGGRFVKRVWYSSPVIEFEPRHLRDDEIARGRIYIQTHSREPGHENALKAYNLLARYIRKWARTTNTKWPIYIGPHVAEACRRGDVRLIDGKKTLEIAWPHKNSASHERRR